jgi:hypothetical protein
MRGATFEDWRNAAIDGYVSGGASADAAAEIVREAAADVEPLAGTMSADLLQTFLLALDIEFSAFVRRHDASAAMRSTESAHTCGRMMDGKRRGAMGRHGEFRAAF